MSAKDLSSTGNCVRWLFVICNIPILMFGLATLAIGIWQIIVESKLEEVLSEDYTAGGAIFIAAGVVSIVVSLLGVYGAIKKHKYVLLVYLAIIVLIVALELVVFGYAVAKADDLDDDQIMMDLQNALRRYYSPNDTEHDKDLNDVVDYIQENWECCGINNTEDWNTTPYFIETGSLPPSCCENEPEECPSNEAYDKGCLRALADAIQDYLYVIVGLAIAFAVFEIALLGMTFYLFMAVHNSSTQYTSV